MAKDSIRLNRVTGIDEKYIYMEMLINGIPVNVMQDRATNQVYFKADDITRLLGVGGSLNEFLSSDKGLDFLSEWMAKNPDKTVEEDMTVLDLFRSI